MVTGVEPKVGPPGRERANLGLCAATSSRLKKADRGKTDRHFKSHPARTGNNLLGNHEIRKGGKRAGQVGLKVGAEFFQVVGRAWGGLR